MSRNIRRRTAVLLLTASVGLLGTMEAQAGGVHRADRLTALNVSLANQLQGFARILWSQAADAWAGLVSAPDASHRDRHNPPGRRCDGETSNGPDIDPDGDRRGGNNNRP
jgi:hypothetical protein